MKVRIYKETSKDHFTEETLEVSKIEEIFGEKFVLTTLENDEVVIKKSDIFYFDELKVILRKEGVIYLSINDEEKEE